VFVFHEHRGELLVAYGSWRVQTSLAFAVIGLIVAIWLLLVVLRIVAGGVLLPMHIRRRWSARHEARQYTALIDGLGRFVEQRWRAAELELKRVDQKSELGGIARLAAACSASFQGNETASARYLADASRCQSLSELGMELTAAELAARVGDHSTALARLDRLNNIAPHHARVLALYADELDHAGAYGQLRGLLSDVGKYANISDKHWFELARRAWSSALADNTDHAESLISTWSRMPSAVKDDSKMVEIYVGLLHKLNVDHEARQTTRKYIDRHWSPGLARLYGQLAGGDTESKLSDVEKWLRKHGHKPELLLLAGRLCLRIQQWDKARQYFEQSQEQESRSEVLLELGSLYEQLGQPDNARIAYRDGLALQVRSAYREDFSLPTNNQT